MGSKYEPSEYSTELQEFAGYKLVIQGRSAHTVDEYMHDLKTFFRYILAMRDGIRPDSEQAHAADMRRVDMALISSVTQTDIFSFLLWLERDRKNSAAARTRKLAAIRGLYEYYTVKKSRLDRDPTVGIDTPRQKKALPKYLSLEESRLLLDTVRADIDSPYRRRNFAIITLFLNCGMRLSELTGIDVSDVDRYLRSVRVLGKGNKERIIYLNDACRDALAEYLGERMSPEKERLGERALFLSRIGKRMNVKTVQVMVDGYFEKAGLGSKHYSVHKLRHTAATLMYREGGVDIRVLKEILGHEQLNTTQIYTHVASSDVEQAMMKNPLAGEASVGELEATERRTKGKKADDGEGE